MNWPQALSWRLGRHMLVPVGDGSAEEVVRRLCGVQAQVASSADLAVRVRQKHSQPSHVAAALASGRLIKTWAMRGTLHLFTPDDAGEYLSLMASTRTWERAIWVRYFGVTADQMQELRAVVRGILGDESMTREELITELTKQRTFSHLAQALRSGWGTIFKPLAWQGDICFGPSRGNRVTFTRPEVASKAWRGVPDVNDAWASVVLRYLGTYGPATPDAFSAWLSRGVIARKQLKAWFADLLTRGDATMVNVEGQEMYVRSEDMESLSKATSSEAVVFLGGFDQWVLGPGTDDGHVTPKGRRTAVSKTAGWIAPVVVKGGTVSGTWESDASSLTVNWFSEAGKVPTRSLTEQTRRISMLVGREFRLLVNRV